MILPPTVDDESLLLLLTMTTQLVCLYGPQLVLLATLSAITVYRREISCNHVYAEEGEEDQAISSSENREDNIVRKRIWNDQMAEELLEGAGSYCSGSALLPLVELFAQWFSLLQQVEKDGTESIGNRCDKRTISALLSSKHNVSASDLLDLAGNYYCGEPVASLLLNKPLQIPKALSIKRTQQLRQAALLETEDSKNDIVSGLPADAWIQIMSFLEPSDVTRFGMINRACCEFVNGSSNGTSRSGRQETARSSDSNRLLWKTLWQRDYGWLLQHWKVGRRAVKQSLEHAPPRHPSQLLLQSNDFTPPNLDKDEYFRFGLCHMDYVLAGNNRLDSCLVGVEGNIYNLTNFLLSHPGSPETVMVHAGQDATQFFHRIGHSRGARKMAQSMCVVVNQGCHTHQCGLRPTLRTELSAGGRGGNTHNLPPSPAAVPPPDECVLMAPSKSNSTALTSKNAAANTLQRIKDNFERTRDRYQVMAQDLVRGRTLVTQPKAYYDPMTQQWKAWYMDQNLNNVFLHHLE
mmetsp:Transcript_20707/g.44818  ORF Transcript_20707/g.44818 Transcript_20707/m.44818 type:complete len:520 (-) Transcript_20707:365-1924(-)